MIKECQGNLKTVFDSYEVMFKKEIKKQRNNNPRSNQRKSTYTPSSSERITNHEKQIKHKNRKLSLFTIEQNEKI